MTIDRALFFSKVSPLLESFDGRAAFCISRIGSEDLAAESPGTTENAAAAEDPSQTFTDSVSYQEDEVMMLASTGKLFILGTLLEQLSEGKEPLDRALLERRVYRREDRVGGSGVIQFLSEGTAFTLHDLALLMIILSDNTATNMLLTEVGGADAVMDHLEKAGVLYSGVNRPISGQFTSPKILQRTSALGLSAHVQNSFSRGSCREIAAYLKGIEEGKILSSAARDIFESMLEKQQFKDMFPRYLPVEDFFEEDPFAKEFLGEGGNFVRVLCKTGFDGGIRSDAGILIIGNDRFSYAVIINEAKDTSYRPEQEAAMLMGRIGRAFYESLR